MRAGGLGARPRRAAVTPAAAIAAAPGAAGAASRRMPPRTPGGMYESLGDGRIVRDAGGAPSTARHGLRKPARALDGAANAPMRAHTDTGRTDLPRPRARAGGTGTGYHRSPDSGISRSMGIERNIIFAARLHICIKCPAVPSPGMPVGASLRIRRAGACAPAAGTKWNLRPSRSAKVERPHITMLQYDTKRYEGGI